MLLLGNIRQREVRFDRSWGFSGEFKVSIHNHQFEAFPAFCFGRATNVDGYEFERSIVREQDKVVIHYR